MSPQPLLEVSLVKVPTLPALRSGPQPISVSTLSSTNAQRHLRIAAYEPAELNDGASVWRGLELSERDQAKVQ